MNKTYKETITGWSKDDGSILDAMHTLQAMDGYLTEEAMSALSEEFDIPETQIYESASFYGMLRFSPPSKVSVQICRNASCHVAGASEVIRAFEEALCISMGESTEDGAYTLEYSECIGQCQASPTVMVNETIHTDMTPDKVRELLKKMEEDR